MRNNFIDSLKFCLIFLVILGHLLGGYVEDSKLNMMVRNFIYLFHMPLFVFISGYFLKNVQFKKQKKGLLKILQTFCVIHLIFLIVKFLDHTLSWIDVITPWWIMWYLLSLLFWRLVVIIKPTFPLYVSILLALAVGFLPFIGYPLSLSRTFVFLPFFILGVSVRQEKLDYMRRLPKTFSITFLLLVFTGLYFNNVNLHAITSGANSYYAFTSPFLGLGFRLVFIFIALLMSLSFINLVPDLRIFSTLGKETLLFYIYHGFLVIGIHLFFSHYNYKPNLEMLILGTVLITVVIYFFSKLKISKVLLNPISYFRSKHPL